MSQQTTRPPARIVAILLLVLVLASGSHFPSVYAQPHSSGDADGLTPGELRDPVLDSRLVALLRSTAAAGAPAIAAESDLSAAVAVSIRVGGSETVAALVPRLEVLGALVANTGVATVEAYVPVTQLRAVAALEGVLSVRPLETPVTSAVTSQGAAIHGSPGWNAQGYTGQGVKVGIIDAGFQGYARLIGSELPQPVAHCYWSAGTPTPDLADCENGERHGTAVAETLIDIAPQASLYIANPRSKLDVHDAVEWMIGQGVTVINQSLGWPWDGPGDGTSNNPDSVYAAVDLAISHGIVWVNAAGNTGWSTWSGDYSDADADGFLDFESGENENGINVTSGRRVRLQLRWDDSWAAAASDVDLYLYDEDGALLTSSEMDQHGQEGAEPYETLSYSPTATGRVYFRVSLIAGPLPAWVDVQALSGQALTEDVPAGSLANPADSANPGLLAAGAASWQSPDEIEDFSGQGPTRDGRIKPDIVGIDFADTVSYGPNGFSGTSQASPHIAGLATLVRQRYPDYTPEDVAEYLMANASQATTPDNVWGHGLAQLPPVNPGDNPLPILHDVAPANVTAGSDALTITVSGANFIPTSVVRVNGSSRPTTYVNSATLTATLDATFTDQPGVLSVVVVNPAPGGGASLEGSVTISEDVPADTTAFTETWARTDDPVATGLVRRTWMWGDNTLTGIVSEPYVEAPGAERTVVYYDKSRMEITDPSHERDDPWYVTNGLLVVELIGGQLQLGDKTFETHEPAQVNVAGDPDDPTGPTYATFGLLRDAAPAADGQPIIARVDRAGSISDDPTLAEYGVTAAWRVTVPGIDHQVASPFWEFMNSIGLVLEDGSYVEDSLFVNPFYATGFPVSEPYWATVKLAGVYQDVLIQCFERRCLTYTPGNPEGWEVEAGNVGQHYHRWRYEE